MNPPTKDIEQGNKDAYVDDPVGNSSGSGANICCCDTRVAGITWFSISLIVETAALIFIFVNRAVWWNIIIDIAFLILTIIGLVGCVQVKKSLAKAGQVGYIIKAVLSGIGIIAFIAIWGTIADILSDNDADTGAFNGILTGVLVVIVLYFIFIVAGAVVVGKFIKEIDGGIFINTE